MIFFYLVNQVLTLFCVLSNTKLCFLLSLVFVTTCLTFDPLTCFEDDSVIPEKLNKLITTRMLTIFNTILYQRSFTSTYKAVNPYR